MTSSVRIALAALVAALVLPGSALAATSVGSVFPSNLYTVPDATQVTGLRVNLSHPNCTTNPSDCDDVAVLNTLDGFNIQPRITIPFSGPVDLHTVTSQTIFLVGPGGHVVGINQGVWQPATDTLHVESDQQLAEDTTYLLVVSRGVHDAGGNPLDATTFRHDLNFGQTKDPAAKAYRKALLDALPMAMAGGVDRDDIAAASLFTTQTIDRESRTIRSQLAGSPVDFALGTGHERTVFPRATVTGIQLNRENVAGTTSASSLLLPALFGVGTIAFGSFSSPNFEVDGVIPSVGTATSTIPQRGTNTLEFTLFLPSTPEPAGGYPTVIFGHGFTDSKDGAPWAVAGTFASNGLATIAINVVGHGGGPHGFYNVQRAGAPTVTLPSGGRSIDQNHDGVYGDLGTEGVSAFGANTLIGNRDGLRQTTIDLMQLVKVLHGGVDVDGDGHADLSTSSIYYAGQSFGGIYGVQFLGLEPDIVAGVPNVPGGSVIEVARLGGFRPLVGGALLTRTPPLYNTAPNPPFYTSFIENMPLRNLPILVDTTPGADAIQQVLDNTEWAQQSGNPAAYAPFITSPVIIQFARGDMTVPNPTTSAILRAGHLQSRATLFRNDLAYATNHAVGKNPHTFLTNIGGAGALYAFEAQAQMVAFFRSNGAVTIDPDGPAPYFETPASMIPEDLGFIP